jgi:hypothetical protein
MISTLRTQRCTRPLTLALTLVLVPYLTGCLYYKAKPIDPPDGEATVKIVQKQDKYIIVHEGTNVWHLVINQIDDSSKVITGYLGPLAAGHNYYRTQKTPGRSNHYKRVPPEQSPVFEVHLYLREPVKRPTEQIKLTFDMIEKVVVYDRDVAATVLSVFGITVAVFATIVAIVALTKSSCPLIYTLSDSTAVFAGETFGGAIYPSLERDDYLPLNSLTAEGGSYRILITNKLQEVQYTNLASLIVVDHAHGTTALMDSHGKIHIVRPPQEPIKAFSRSGDDQFLGINRSDDNAFSFDNTQVAPDEQALFLTFKRPSRALSGRLILRLKNSFWFDHVYGQFNQLFGTGYNVFAQRQRKATAAKLKQWGLEQQIPLTVAIQGPSGWKLIDRLDCVGPLAYRELVVNVNLADEANDEVTVRLSTGFMFWEIDYAAMDFSAEKDFAVHRLQPITASDEKGLNVRSPLLAADKDYLIQPHIGNETTITYLAPVIDKQYQRRSIFLHARGYYEYIRDYHHPPDIVRLLEFRHPGSLARYSREQLDSMCGEQLIPAVLTTALYRPD